MSSSSKARRVARIAAQEAGDPAWVSPCMKGESVSSSVWVTACDRRIAEAAWVPLVRPLDVTRMSGSSAHAWLANSGPVRPNPVATSSATIR